MQRLNARARRLLALSYAVNSHAEPCKNMTMTFKDYYLLPLAGDKEKLLAAGCETLGRRPEDIRMGNVTCCKSVVALETIQILWPMKVSSSPILRALCRKGPIPQGESSKMTPRNQAEKPLKRKGKLIAADQPCPLGHHFIENVFQSPKTMAASFSTARHMCVWIKLLSWWHKRVLLYRVIHLFDKYMMVKQRPVNLSDLEIQYLYAAAVFVLTFGKGDGARHMQMLKHHIQNNRVELALAQLKGVVSFDPAHRVLIRMVLQYLTDAKAAEFEAVFSFGGVDVRKTDHSGWTQSDASYIVYMSTQLCDALVWVYWNTVQGFVKDGTTIGRAIKILHRFKLVDKDMSLGFRYLSSEVLNEFGFSECIFNPALESMYTVDSYLIEEYASVDSGGCLNILVDWLLHFGLPSVSDFGTSLSTGVNARTRLHKLMAYSLLQTQRQSAISVPVFGYSHLVGFPNYSVNLRNIAHQSFFYLIISIPSIATDVFQQIADSHTGSLRLPLRVIYRAASKVADLGGVQREAFSLLCQRLRQGILGMVCDESFSSLTYSDLLETDEESRRAWFPPYHATNPSKYAILGAIIGIAFLNSIPFPMYFPPFFEDMLLRPYNANCDTSSHFIADIDPLDALSQLRPVSSVCWY